jgi:hypothetical protein
MRRLLLVRLTCCSDLEDGIIHVEANTFCVTVTSHHPFNFLTAVDGLQFTVLINSNNGNASFAH